VEEATVMDNASELISALEQVSREKGIDKEAIFEAIGTSLVLACKKNFGSTANIHVNIDRVTGEVKVYASKEVVDDIADESTQISLSDAQAIRPGYAVGDIVDIVVTPRNFGRISAQTAKQVIVQKFREIEREQLHNEYISKDKEIITGIVQRRERRNVLVSIGKLEAIMPPNEQIQGEPLNFGDRIKVYVTEVKQTTKGPSVTVSRTHPELVRRLFEQEVPEVNEGIVDIRSIAREAGSRTKIAVVSKLPEVDALGACVGQNGSRVNIIVTELRGEKIDIVNWDEDYEKYISSALSPSRVTNVIVNTKSMSAKVIVPDNQLSLAIGKDGQNARLCAKLTGFKIDIKSESQAKESEPVHDDYDYDEYGDEYDDGYDDYDDEYDDDYEYDDDEYDDDYDDTYDDEYDDDYDDEYDDDYEEDSASKGEGSDGP